MVPKSLINMGLTKIKSPVDKNVFYIETPDGYRLIYHDNEYVGRYNPNPNPNEVI